MLRLLTALTLVALLIGCANKPVIVKEVEYVFIKVPTELTTPVTPTAPFDPVVYSQYNWDTKEKTLFDFINTRSTELGVCNARLTGVSTWSIKQKQIYTKEVPLKE